MKIVSLMLALTVAAPFEDFSGSWLLGGVAIYVMHSEGRILTAICGAMPGPQPGTSHFTCELDEGVASKAGWSMKQSRIQVDSGTMTFVARDRRGREVKGIELSLHERNLVPERCTVRVPRASFEGIGTQTSAYLVKGDVADVVSLDWGPSEGSYVFVRYRGKATTTVGIMKAPSFDCSASDGGR